MELGWLDLVVDKRGVRANAADLMTEWLWLAPQDTEPMLPTACGDVFLRRVDGSIAFLDTYVGSCATVAQSYEQWKIMLDDPDRLEAWFRGGLIEELLTAGLRREPAECFSPYLPQGGTDNLLRPSGN